jgi:replicative DNA helicase
MTAAAREKDVAQQVIAAEAIVRRTDVQRGVIPENRGKRYAERIIDLGKVPLYIASFPDPQLDVLCTEIARLREDQGIELVVVDPMAAISVDSDFCSSREHESSVVARRFKSVALEFQIPIVVTAELGQRADNEVRFKPRLGDLLNSDLLAHFADNIILLHRPDAFDQSDPRMGEADLILAKHRSGPTGEFTVAHQLHYGRFVDMAQG